jgi:hypothetical protein
MDNTEELKTIAKYKFGNTECEICAKRDITDKDIEQFNKTSKYFNLVKQGENKNKNT